MLCLLLMTWEFEMHLFRAETINWIMIDRKLNSDSPDKRLIV